MQNFLKNNCVTSIYYWQKYARVDIQWIATIGRILQLFSGNELQINLIIVIVITSKGVLGKWFYSTLGSLQLMSSTNENATSAFKKVAIAMLWFL